MRLILISAVTALAASHVIAGMVVAQSQPASPATEYGKVADNSTGTKADKIDPGNADKPQSTEGRTVAPETKGQMTPQGWSGPINTESGGAPASSPQGQSPPGMQPAPEGSNKTTVEPEAK